RRRQRPRLDRDARTGGDVRRPARRRPRRRRRLHGVRTAAARPALDLMRVLLTDDQALVRGGFRLILDAEPDIDVVAEAGDGEEAVARAVETRPDLVLMDIRMPKLDGIQATQQLLAELDATRVLILTTF